MNTLLLAAFLLSQGWVDQLKNPSGVTCCANHDGDRLSDLEWDAQGSSYRVRFAEGWIIVPPEAVVTEPNRDGIARVWSYFEQGKRHIRCFLPGGLG